MARLKDTSWLLAICPPYDTKKPTGERALWWAVIRTAGKDLRYSHRSEALDALEWLKLTGLWLLTEVYWVPPDEAKGEITALVFRRQRERGEDLVRVGGLS